MLSIILFVLICVIPLSLFFVAAAFHRHQRGRPTWGWVRRLYDALGAGRVKW